MALGVGSVSRIARNRAHLVFASNLRHPSPLARALWCASG